MIYLPLVTASLVVAVAMFVSWHWCRKGHDGAGWVAIIGGFIAAVAVYALVEHDIQDGKLDGLPVVTRQ